MSQSSNTKPFIRTSDNLLSLWQTSVLESVHKTVAESDPSVVLNSTQVMFHPTVLATNKHVDSFNGGKELPTPKQSDFEGKTQKQIDSDPDLQAYCSQEFFKAAAAAGKTAEVALPPPSIIGFPYSDYALKEWAAVLVIYTRYHLGGSTSNELYNDWTVAGQNNIDYGVIPYTLPADAKVVILGDFGTGLPDAQAMLTTIMTELEPDCILHVGDVYYSGSVSESQANMVDVFNAAFAAACKSVPVFSIPGNHEYLGDSKGFYQNVMTINGNPNQSPSLPGSVSQYLQQASYFCLRSEDGNWQFLGMDTGFYSVPSVSASIGPNLHPSEVQWHQDKLENFSGNTILLSHHQLFSANAEINSGYPGNTYLNDYTLSYFRPYFDKISGWFWGHEHSLGVFQDGLYGLQKGRLVGNSGYEEYTGQNTYTVNNSLAPYSSPMVQVGSTSVDWGGSTNNWYNHGCALIDLSNTTSPAVSYYQFPVWVDSSNAPSNPQLTVIPNGTETLSTAANPYFQGWTSGFSSISDYASTNMVLASTSDGATQDMIIVSGDGLIYSLDPATGAQLGYFMPTGETGEMKLLVANNYLYVSSGSSGYVYCRELKPTLDKVWSEKLNSHETTTNMAFGNGNLVLGYHGDAQLVDPNTGSSIKEQSLEAILNEDVTVAVNGSYIFCGCHGNVFVLNSSDLSQVTKIDIELTADVNVYAFDGLGYAGTDGTVSVFDADGSNNVKVDLSGNGEVRLAYDGSTIYAGTDGSVTALDPTTLSVISGWTTTTLPATSPGNNVPNIVCNGGYLFVGCYGNLFKLDGATGALLLSYEYHGWQVPVILNGDGVVGIFSKDNIISGQYVECSFAMCVSQDTLT